MRRWCVTGTPFNSKIETISGQFEAIGATGLHHEDYWKRLTTESDIAKKSARSKADRYARVCPLTVYTLFTPRYAIDPLTPPILFTYSPHTPSVPGTRSKDPRHGDGIPWWRQYGDEQLWPGDRRSYLPSLHDAPQQKHDLS